MTNLAEVVAEYAALTRGAGVARLPGRTQLDLVGPDAPAFLHNLCTNHVTALAPGRGCEAMLLNAKGRVIGHVLAFRREDRVSLDAAAGFGATLADHFDRYLFREKVEIVDRTPQLDVLLLVGPAAARLVGDLAGAAPVQPLDHAETACGGAAVHLRRVEMALPAAYQLAVAKEDAPRVVETLRAAGAADLSEALREALRIEAGWPEYGHDISEENLAQELDRNERAIHFKKGCYLGQETVARIDALGHVNRALRGLVFAAGAAAPALGAGAALRRDGKPVGAVTSAAFSPRLGLPIGLGYVRREHFAPGTRLEAEWGAGEVAAAEVVVLPFA